MKNASYLFSDRRGIKRLLRGKFVYLFLDNDGTLTPIARTPDEAIMPKRTRGLLRRISKMPNCKMAIVSGRALKDISKRVGLKNIVYVGNHGFEITGPKIKFESPLPRGYRRTLEAIKDKLKKRFSSFGGVIIEDKVLSISVHYRLVDKSDVPAFVAGFQGIIFPYELKKKVQVKSGKMVFEVRPPVNWNKGKAVLWLLNRQLSAMRNKGMKVLPIYVGDDTTDEDAFRSLRNKGITVFVGSPDKTRAGSYLKDTEEVVKFLDLILHNVNSGDLWARER